MVEKGLASGYKRGQQGCEAVNRVKQGLVNKVLGL